MIDRPEWPARPWIYGAIAATGGVLISLLTDHQYGDPMAIWKQIGATFVAVATIGLVVTLERQRWTWTVAFALGCGAMMALVGWFTASYNHDGTIFEFPYFSGLFAALVAAPFFQASRDAGRFNRNFADLHGYAWSDAVIGAASLAFTGLVFGLAYMVSALFDAIGIDLLRDLLNNEQFDWALAGFAFGGGSGLLRESDKMLKTLLRLVILILGVLAPAMAVLLGLFLLALPVTGFANLWDSGLPETPLMLTSAAWAVLLTNAIIGTGDEDRHPRRFFIWSAMALSFMTLPLALISAVSLGMRINQYGWTPSRIWGVIAIGFAIAYGLAATWSLLKGRMGFDGLLRDLQVKIAMALVGAGLFLALPIVDFGAISARSQLARLDAGKVSADEFDWRAMAFDFGPTGRKRLEAIVNGNDKVRADFAEAALNADNRWDVDEAQTQLATEQALDDRIIMRSEGVELTPELRSLIAAESACQGERCALIRLDDGRLLIVGSAFPKAIVLRSVIDPATPQDGKPGLAEEVENPLTGDDVDLATANIEVREEPMKRVYVDGKPVGDLFR